MLKVDASAAVKVDRQQAQTVQRAGMLMRTFYLDVKDTVHTLNRFEVRFMLDGEAIQHSKELAAQMRHRHFPRTQGLVIAVIDQANRKIHEEVVYPQEEHQPDRTSI